MKVHPGAVPDAADEVHHQNVQVCTAPALSAAAQGKVDVLPEEGRQGHVPAFPELRNGKAPVGRVEVDGQPQSQQPGAAGSKVAIPGKVEIKLKRVAQDHAPRGQSRQLREAAPAVVHQHAQIVRQQHLFGKAEADGVQDRLRYPGAGERPPAAWGKKFPGFKMGPEDTVGKKKL